VTEDIPELPREQPRRRVSGVSAVWLVPLAALIVAIGAGISAYNDRGPVIRIAFDSASGILPKETELRFRNVPVGIVEEVAFNNDLTRVLVDVRVEKSVAPFIDDSAAFWIVQPEVTTSGVTGLETVLSGVYIEGSWDTTPDGAVYDFIGLPQAPLQTTYRRGVTFELRSSRSSGLSENTPILFKGIEVGRLGSARISQDGQSVFADAIIYEPHDRLVTTATRFWDASGFSISFGPNGAELDFSSLASLISGGITFDTLVSGGQPLESGLVFDVFPDQTTARNSVFEDSDGETITLTMVFNDNVSGLAADADVEWRGVRIGRVINVTASVDQARFGDARVRLLATAQITPSRFGLGGDVSAEDVIAYLSERVDEGLRARLASASILTGGLKVEFVTDLAAPPAQLDADADPFPTFPVTDSEIADVSATAEGVFERVNALPVEALLASAIAFMDNATALVASPELRDAPTEILGLLTDARGVLGSEELQALPKDARDLLAGLQQASASLNVVLDELQQANAVDRLLKTVDQAGAAAEAVNAALSGVPKLTAEVTAFVETANTLPLEELVTQATGLAADVRTYATSDAMAALPGSVVSAVEGLADLLDDVAEANTTNALTQTLTDAGSAAQAIETAVAGVPALIGRLDTIAANAEDLELAALVSELEVVLAAASRLFGQASEADLPDALAQTLAETQQALAELRAGGLVDNANATLASASSAAAAIESAANQLPSLVDRLNATLGQAQATLGDFDANSAFAPETSSVLREVERAAEAITDLARAIERRPNSIILGR